MDGMKEKSKEKGTLAPLPIYMLLLSVFFILAGILILNISIYSQNEILANAGNIHQNDQSTQVNSPAEALYIMKENGGKISIYDAKTNSIIKTLDVYVFTLPESDRNYLKKGIEIFSEAELLALIEDYTG